MSTLNENTVENWEFSEEDDTFLNYKELLEAFDNRAYSEDENMESDSTPLLRNETVNAQRLGQPTSSVQSGNDDGQQQRMTPFVYLLTFMSAIGGFLFGYDTGIVSGAMILLKGPFTLSSFWQELVVSITIAFAAIASFSGGFLNNMLGRKPVIIGASFVFTVGAIVLGVAVNRSMLLIGRAILGIGIGLASMTVPMYIAECAPFHLRGRMVTLNNVFITFGQVVAAVIAGIFSYDKDNGWRYMLGLAGVPSLIQFIGFFFMPESPRWLVGNNKEEQATEILKRIRGTELVSDEMKSIKETTEEDERILMEQGGSRFIFIKVLQSAPVRRALFVGCMLQCFQQISGINTVMYYSATIIKLSGVEDESLAIWLASLTAAVNFLFTLVGLWLVERIGRRSLTLGSLVGTAVSLAILAIGFQLAAHHSPPVSITEFTNTTEESLCANYTFCDPCMRDKHCGFCYDDGREEGPTNGSCLAISFDWHGDPVTDHAVNGRCSATSLTKPITWAYDYCPTNTAWMSTFGLVLYLVFFAPGMGPMPWTINSEIYPLWARGTGNSLATMTNWLFNLLISMTFLTLTEVLTRYGAFWLYTCFAFTGCIFVYFFLPETKGKKLEEVEQLFQKPWCSK